MHKALFNLLTTAVPFPQNNESDSSLPTSDDSIKLTDCLREFKQLETLDEENMWYCTKCKDHV